MNDKKAQNVEWIVHYDVSCTMKYCPEGNSGLTTAHPTKNIPVEITDSQLGLSLFATIDLVSQPLPNLFFGGIGSC